MRLVVDADTRAPEREVVGERRGEGLDAVVEIREQRPVQMIVGRLGGSAVGVERVEVRRRISLDHNRHRAEQRRAVTVLGGRRRPGRIRHRTGPEQHQTVDALRFELVLQALETFGCASAGDRACPGSPVRRWSLLPPNRRWLPPPWDLSSLKMQR